MGNSCEGSSNRRNSSDRSGAQYLGRNQVVPSEMSGCNNLGDLRIGSPAPKWTAPAVLANAEMKDISLDNYKDRYEEFKKIECEVIAASTDSKYSHYTWVSTPRSEGGLGNLNIPLVADKTCDIARRYGVYKADEGISLRGLFIIDTVLNLRQITINDNAVGRSVDETLRLVQAFQYADKYGEVCPVNWKPGEKGIKTNSTPSQAAQTKSGNTKSKAKRKSD